MCSEVLTQKSGWITAPDENNDGLYDNSLVCSWFIKGQTGEQIKFEMVFARLESSDCEGSQTGDFLYVSIPITKTCPYTGFPQGVKNRNFQ